MKEKKNKKTIFIVVGVIAVVVVVAFLIFSSESNTKVYEVGKDIEAGEYILVGTGKNKLVEASEGKSEKVYGYYAICTTKECNNDNNDIVTNNNVTGKAYVIVEEGQYLQTKSMKLYKVSEYKSNVENSLSYDYKLGASDYYKVGKDLNAGTYTFTGDNFYYAVCSKPSCSTIKGEIITNEYIEGSASSSTVTVENGQYLVVSGTKPFTASKQ